MEKKRSLRFLIVSACLALLLVSIGGIIAGAQKPVTVDDGLKISGATLDLNNKISIAFAVKADAVNYTEGEKLGYALYLYDSNPGTEAGNGKKVEDFVVRTIGGEQYVLFVTDGFNPLQYKNTVYARVGNNDGTVFGEVQKTGVLELAYKQQAKFQAQLATATDETKDAINTRVKLFTAIINYGINADLVVSGATQFKYSYVTVSDGYIDDGMGGKWTGGVYANGTKINLVDNIPEDFKYYTVGGIELYGWTNGTVKSAGNTYTVTASENISPIFQQTKIDNNPTTTRWFLGGKTSATNFNWNLLSSTVAGNPAISYTGTDTSAASKAITRVVSVNEDGDAVITYEYNHKQFTLDGKYTDAEALAYLAANKLTNIGDKGWGIQEDHQWFRYSNNNVVAGQPYTMAFDIFFPGTDKNGNGEKYEAGVYVEETAHTTVEEVYNDEIGETEFTEVTTYTYETKNGDMFIHDTGKGMLRIPIRFTTIGATNTIYWAMYVELVAVVKDGKVTGFYVQTGGSSKTDTNIQSFSDKVFDITEWHTMQFKVTPTADGKIEKIDIIVDNDVIATHLASNGEAKLGLGSGTISDVHVTGDSKIATTEYGVQSYGRFNGDVQFRNIYADYSTVLTAEEIKANTKYNANATNYTENVYITSYTASGRTQYAWNSLNTLAGANKFGTYTSSKGNTAVSSWRYDSLTNSVVYSKFSKVQNANNDAGLFTVLIENPLYNKTWQAGTTVVFEFTQAYGAIDTDGDLKFSEWNNDLGDNGVNNDVSGQNTSVYGFMNFGYGDGTGAATYTQATYGGNRKASISATNSIFAALRINNYRTTQENHNLQMSYRSGDAEVTVNGTKYTADTTASSLGTLTFGGAAITYRYELDIGDNGVPTELRIYANGTLMTTRYNHAHATGKDNMSTFGKVTDAPALTANIFAAPYIEISYFADRYVAGSVIFSNIHAWSVIGK